MLSIVCFSSHETIILLGRYNYYFHFTDYFDAKGGEVSEGEACI